MIKILPDVPLEQATEKVADVPDTETAVPEVQVLSPHIRMPLSLTLYVNVIELSVPDVVEIVRVPASEL